MSRPAVTPKSCPDCAAPTPRGGRCVPCAEEHRRAASLRRHHATTPDRPSLGKTPRLLALSHAADSRGGRRPDQERLERLAKAYALGELHDEGAVSVDDIVRELGPMTLGEVGVVFGVTRERVRQIEVRALDKLRRGEHELERPSDVDTWADAFEREAVWL